jgi:hypothetical protein
MKFENREQVMRFTSEYYGKIKKLGKDAFLDYIEAAIEAGVCEGETEGFQMARNGEISGVDLEDHDERIQQAYDDGYADAESDHEGAYDDGYRDGHNEAEEEHAGDYDSGYEDGYADAENEYKER